jgi:hypothetical protein
VNVKVITVLKISTGSDFFIFPLSNDGGTVMSYSNNSDSLTIFNQYVTESLDGDLSTYERDPFSIRYREVLLLNVSRYLGESFMRFIRDILHFGEVPFTIEVLGNPCSKIDLGLGDTQNPKVTNCHLTVDSTSGLFNFKAPAVYDIRIPYSFLQVG